MKIIQYLNLNYLGIWKFVEIVLQLKIVRARKQNMVDFFNNFFLEIFQNSLCYFVTNQFSSDDIKYCRKLKNQINYTWMSGLQASDTMTHLRLVNVVSNPAPKMSPCRWFSCSNLKSNVIHEIKKIKRHWKKEMVLTKIGLRLHV